MAISWEKDAKQEFDAMIAKIPIFLRDIAKDKVSKRAENIAIKDNRSEITEKDMVDAFFAETPFGFHGPMKSDMESLGIDYLKYGHPR